MSAPIRKVTIDRKTGAAVQIVRDDAPTSDPAAQYVETLRVYQQGYVAGFVECMKRNGPWAQLAPAQQDAATKRWRETATALVERRAVK